MLITTNLLEEIKSEIDVLLSMMQRESFDGYESTVLIDVKPDSFRFVMNQIKEVLNEV